MTFPLWCLFAAALLLVVTKVPVAIAMAHSSSRGYDNRNPRLQQLALTGWGARAMASHANMFEAFPVFAAGVLVAQVTGTAGSVINLMAGLFIAARLAYSLFYLLDLHLMRSLVWGVGFISSLGLLMSPVLL